MTTSCLTSRSPHCCWRPAWPGTGPTGVASGQWGLDLCLDPGSCACLTSGTCVSRHNDDKTFLVWVNEEDHLRVISMQKGGNMREVFTRFCTGLTKVSAHPLPV